MLEEAFLFVITLLTRDTLFEMLQSTTVDEQNLFISGLTGNNLITNAKKGIVIAGYCDFCD